MPDHGNSRGKGDVVEWPFANISIDGNRLSSTIPKPCKYSRRAFFNTGEIQISCTSEYFSIQNYPNPRPADAMHILYSLTSRLGRAILKRIQAQAIRDTRTSSITSAVLPGSFFSFSD